MRLNPSRGRMFPNVNWTGTYYQGCDHDCVYCWAKWMKVSHKPKLIQTDPTELLKVRDCVVFLNSAHDGYSNCIPGEWIKQKIQWMNIQDPSIIFYEQSKNTPRMRHYVETRQLETLKHRIILGTTIETDDATLAQSLSKAPIPYIRAVDMVAIRDLGYTTRLGLEPLYRFNPTVLANWIKTMRPSEVMAGLDNYAHRHKHIIPQPRIEDYRALRGSILDQGITLVEKQSIQKWRLRAG